MGQDERDNGYYKWEGDDGDGRGDGRGLWLRWRLDRWEAEDRWEIKPDNALKFEATQPLGSLSLDNFPGHCQGVHQSATSTSPGSPCGSCTLCRDLKGPDPIAHDFRALDLRFGANKNLDHLNRGLPLPLQAGSPDHFKLMKEWLRLCDRGKCTEGHTQCFSESPQVVPPTRLIDLGCSINLGPLQLGNLGRGKIRLITPHRPRRYIALSHCWGDLPTDEKGKWITTSGNLEPRTKTGFHIDILPATFRDAVIVTRKLSIRYLWIDSLCILQGDKDDWASEAGKMQDVFRGAYCTIAASSAQDSTQGFLARPAPNPGKWVCTTQAGGPSTFATTFLDNFKKDVEEGILNTRAWVLQERALSKRTLHFTDRQTYWECGGGVRCETLTYMRNHGSILSDPKFPENLGGVRKQKQFEIPHKLIAQYSGLNLTNHTDRGAAIRSLMNAMAKTVDTKVDFGVFHKFTHRSLLWRRDQEAALIKIHYPEQMPPPSWSWESYTGKIDYLVWEPEPEWDTSVTLDTARMTARVKRLQAHERESINLSQVLRDNSGCRVGYLWLDVEIKDLKKVRCAILGRLRCKRSSQTEIMGLSSEGPEGPEGEEVGWKYYVLLVMELETVADGYYKRVGAGVVDEGCISFEGDDKPAWIV